MPPGDFQSTLVRYGGAISYPFSVVRPPHPQPALSREKEVGAWLAAPISPLPLGGGGVGGGASCSRFHHGYALDLDQGVAVEAGVADAGPARLVLREELLVDLVDGRTILDVSQVDVHLDNIAKRAAAGFEYALKVQQRLTR